MGSREVSVTVLSGPDEGKTRRYSQPRVTLGRDQGNDFVLSDGFVSNEHAEFTLRDDGKLLFRDLKSRHGSTVVINNSTRKLHNEDRETQLTIKGGTEVQLGSSLLRFDISSATERPTLDNEDLGRGRRNGQPKRHVQDQSEDEPADTDDDDKVVVENENLITTAHRPVQTINRRLESADTRLAALFHLAGQLNGLTALDEMLELIVETTFQSFRGANFFAVTLGSDPDEVSTREPFMTQARGEVPLPEGEDAPLLSTSILRRVASTRESVLFTKDSIGSEVTQSILDAKITACMCAPLVGQKSLLGIMQVDTRGRGSLFTRQDLELFNILASNAAFAIERARLTESIMEMFEGFVAASVNAIEARDPVTAGHSERVAHYTLALAEVVNDIETTELRDVHLDPEEMRELRYAALLHDFGKIAVREDVIQKGARLPDEQMKLIRQRFDTIKELSYRQWLYEYAQKLEANDRSYDERGLSQIDEYYHALSHKLDETYQWIQKISTKGYLQDEELARVRALGEKTFFGPDGEQHPYLTPIEVENLCIRKGTLNEEEWKEMRSHAALSESYLDQIPWSDELQLIPCIAGAHHEKLDGSGYPQGLQGDEIMPQVRMLTISDIFDALTASDRPYRKAASIDRALEILNLESGDDKLDSHLVEVFGSIVIPRIEDDVLDPKK